MPEPALTGGVSFHGEALLFFCHEGGVEVKPYAKESAGAAASFEAVLIQPPLVQLNGPYPAPYYLAAF
jgi:hypothetical protein